MSKAWWWRFFVGVVITLLFMAVALFLFALAMIAIVWGSLFLAQETGLPAGYFSIAMGAALLSVFGGVLWANTDTV